MTNEQLFIKNLSDYFQIEINDFDKERVLGYLKDYVENYEAPKEKKVAPLTKIVFKYIERSEPIDTNVITIVEPSCILSLISNFTKVSLTDMKGRIRKFEFVLARHTAMYFINKLCHESLVATGKIFNRDHTSVIHAIRHVRDMSEIKHQKYIALIDYVLTEIQPKEKTA